MKKKIWIIVGAILSFFVVAVIGGYIYYQDSLKAVGTSDETITFIVENGSTTKQIIDELYSANLIKNKYTGYIFIKLNNGYVLQAGVYDLNRGMNIKEILDNLNQGNVVDNSISVTFVEGKRLKTYVTQISETFGYSEDEIYAKLSDQDYLNQLIEKYWFLTDDILNDKLYYALEGYLYPNTYTFLKSASIEDIITKMLNATDVVLSKYEDDIKNSQYSLHEMLTMASIVELEGSNSDDRKGVAGVFYNRLNSGWSLGSDVTTYYGAQVEMSERELYQYEIEEVNDYNTRAASMAGKLPVGPICNPSGESIEAALEPEEHNYYYFVADKNGKTYFSQTSAEHQAIIEQLKSQGLWYIYE